MQPKTSCRGGPTNKTLLTFSSGRAVQTNPEGEVKEMDGGRHKDEPPRSPSRKNSLPNRGELGHQSSTISSFRVCLICREHSVSSRDNPHLVRQGYTGPALSTQCGSLADSTPELPAWLPRLCQVGLAM